MSKWLETPKQSTWRIIIKILPCSWYKKANLFVIAEESYSDIEKVLAEKGSLMMSNHKNATHYNIFKKNYM